MRYLLLFLVICPMRCQAPIRTRQQAVLSIDLERGYVAVTGRYDLVYDFQTSTNLVDWETESQFSGAMISIREFNLPCQYFRAKVH